MVHAQKEPPMNIQDIFPSKYLRAADLNGRPVTVTIIKAAMEELGYAAEKESKLVLSFAKASKSLICNRTVAMTIAKLYGMNTDDWINKRVTLYPTRVRAFGQTHEVVRVKEDMPPVPKPPSPAAAQVEENDIDDENDLLDDEGQEPPHNSPTDAPTAPHVPSSHRDDQVSADDAPDPLWDAPAPPRATKAELDALDVVGIAYYTKDYWLGKLPDLVLGVTTGATNNPRELTPDECTRLIRGLERLNATNVRQATRAWDENGKVTA